MTVGLTMDFILSPKPSSICNGIRIGFPSNPESHESHSLCASCGGLILSKSLLNQIQDGCDQEVGDYLAFRGHDQALEYWNRRNVADKNAGEFTKLVLKSHSNYPSTVILPLPKLPGARIYRQPSYHLDFASSVGCPAVDYNGVWQEESQWCRQGSFPCQSPMLCYCFNMSGSTLSPISFVSYSASEFIDSLMNRIDAFDAHGVLALLSILVRIYVTPDRLPVTDVQPCTPLRWASSDELLAAEQRIKAFGVGCLTEGSTGAGLRGVIRDVYRLFFVKASFGGRMDAVLEMLELCADDLLADGYDGDSSLWDAWFALPYTDIASLDKIENSRHPLARYFSSSIDSLSGAAAGGFAGEWGVLGPSVLESRCVVSLFNIAASVFRGKPPQSVTALTVIQTYLSSKFVKTSSENSSCKNGEGEYGYYSKTKGIQRYETGFASVSTSPSRDDKKNVHVSTTFTPAVLDTSSPTDARKAAASGTPKQTNKKWWQFK